MRSLSTISAAARRSLPSLGLARVGRSSLCASAAADVLSPASECSGPAAVGTSITDQEFRQIQELIYREAGISLSEAKRALVCSRLAKRLRHLRLNTHTEYLHYLAKRDPQGAERQVMVNCLTTNKTDFFREPHHFAFLRDIILPAIEQRASRGGPRRVRIWSAACSRGHEPYTIAITILEYFAARRGWDVQILASDINTEVLDVAREGVFPLEQVEVVGERILQRHFLRGTGRCAGSCQVRPEVRRLVTFRQVNLMDDPWPIRTQFDVIFCRNVLIYFDVATQRKLTIRLSQQLTAGGHLMLGHSEHPAWLADHLALVGNTVYQQRRETKARECVAPVPSPLPAPLPAMVRTPQPVKVPVIPRREIIAGEVEASAAPTEISTVLGSCVAVCLFDPERRIGGMNHFMLPYHTLDPVVSARYGVHAMEILINAIMKLGGDRRRLRAKAFGASRVLSLNDAPWNVARRNAQFIRDFLRTENIPLVAERLEDEVSLRVHFLTDSGKAFVKVIAKFSPLVNRERHYSERAAEQVIHPRPGNVTLF